MQVDKNGLYRHLKLKPADQRLLDNIIETTSANHARETNIEKDKEIERLKGLINGQAYSIWKGCDSDMPFDEWNKLFVHGNNL